ncbi:hypothetical protein [Sandaracinobacteroides hominis]|uniref:hypothetical protein n=1 Tax=Sandaracinobacteroides hominis TaxID=2780086 RepID=UPI0018F790B6|nr:hypothetical protein [Sandaracinobacteroides hominis]
MSRRKGERPVQKRLADAHLVNLMRRSIASGSDWFQAWQGQECTPLHQLSKLTGIPTRRLQTLPYGGAVSRAEIDALARAWCVSTSDLISTLPNPALIVE